MGTRRSAWCSTIAKIKRFVPDYCATVPFGQGIRRTLAWFDADPSRRQIDAEANAAWDKLLDSYERGYQRSSSVLSRLTSVALHHFLGREFRSRDSISLNVNLSAPAVTPKPTPVSIFTVLVS